MTKEQLEKKIKEILAKDKEFKGSKIKIVYKKKNITLKTKYKSPIYLSTFKSE